MRTADLSCSLCHCAMQTFGRDSFAESLFRDNRQKNCLFKSCKLLLSRGCLYVITPSALSMKTSMMMDEAPYSSSGAFQMNSSFFLLLQSENSFSGSLLLEHLVTSFPLNLVDIPTQAALELYL